MTHGAGQSQGRRRNATADRVLDILLMFDGDQLVLSATAVATRLGVARSTAYRHLQSLTANDFMDENGSGFRPGPRVMDLARLARKSVGLSDLARPVMRELVVRTGMFALLTRRTGATADCLKREDAGAALRLSYERGQVLAVNAGPAELSLLALGAAAGTRQLPGRSAAPLHPRRPGRPCGSARPPG